MRFGDDEPMNHQPRSLCAEETPPERVPYFTGQLLTADDLAAEQTYVVGKQHRHNRMLHGSGVVCGLLVEATDPPSARLVVQPGMAIDCCGRELVLTDELTIDPSDLLEHPATGSVVVTGRAFVTVEYEESEVAPTPVPGMDDPDARRIRETVRVSISPERPQTSEPPAASRPCPPCPDPRVTLAAVDLSPPITTDHIDNGVRRAIGQRGEARVRPIRPAVCGIAVAAFAAGWLVRSRRR